LTLVPFSVFAFLAGERDHVGSAHLTLITMMAIGLTLLAANFTSRRAISLLIVTGCAVDFLLGVFLQVRASSTWRTRPTPPSLRASRWANWP